MIASSPKLKIPTSCGIVFLSEYLPHVLDSHSLRLENRSSNEILPSPSQSKLSPSVSSNTSPSMSGLMLHKLPSKSHSANQYSNPSYIPSPSVSGLVGSVIPIRMEMKLFAGSPFCQSLKSSSKRFPRVSFEINILNILWAFSVGCSKSPSMCNRGASEGCSIPLSGFEVTRANSCKSIKPSSSESNIPSPGTSGFNVQVSADWFQVVNSNSTPSIIPSPSVSTLFGSPVNPVRFR